VTLYVAASNLVPEFQQRRRGLPTLVFLGGVAVFGLTEWLLSRWPV